MKQCALYLLGAAILASATVHWADEPKPQKDPASNPATSKKADSDKADRSTSARDEKNSSNSKMSADEAAIRKTAESYIEAYQMGDAKKAASHFTEDAEYVDEHGNAYAGRKEIENVLTKCFEGFPGGDIDISIGSIKFVTPTVALEDGELIVDADDNGEPTRTHYTAVHVKQEGKWMVASIRERAPKDRRQHRSQLNQLAWLQGEWIDEDRDSTVYFNCLPVDHGNFLLRAFTVHLSGEYALSGTQRIGWDPLNSRLRTWIFDSEGGFGEGFWYHDDEDRWLLKAVGVTADGQMVSTTTIYKLVNEYTMTWQSVDNEVGGVSMPDSDVVTIVRRAAPPNMDEAVDEAKAIDNPPAANSKVPAKTDTTESKSKPKPESK